MNAEILNSFIKKYYLDGITEECTWDLSPDNITVKFMTSIGDCVGEINLTTNTGFETQKIGILDTTSFLSMIDILEGPINFEIETSPNGVAMKAILSDSNYESNYHLADLNLFRKVPRVDEPTYDLEIKIDNDFATKFNRGKGAINKEVNRFTIESGTQNGVSGVKIVIGGKESLSHKIKIFHEDPLCTGTLSKQAFNANVYKAIFQANKSFDNGILKVSNQGLSCLILNSGDITCKYFVVKMMDSD